MTHRVDNVTNNKVGHGFLVKHGADNDCQVYKEAGNEIGLTGRTG